MNTNTGNEQCQSKKIQTHKQEVNRMNWGFLTIDSSEKAKEDNKTKATRSDLSRRIVHELPNCLSGCVNKNNDIEYQGEHYKVRCITTGDTIWWSGVTSAIKSSVTGVYFIDTISDPPNIYYCDDVNTFSKNKIIVKEIKGFKITNPPPDELTKNIEELVKKHGI